MITSRGDLFDMYLLFSINICIIAIPFSSDRLVDEQISVAINMKENLQNQHYNLRDISRKINTITSE